MAEDPRFAEIRRRVALRIAAPPAPRLRWTFRGALSATVAYAPMMMSLLYPHQEPADV